jgi:Rrf2 family protein
MKITGLEEYGLRSILRLAEADEATSMAASEIAEKEGMTVEYVRKFMYLFRQAELVKAVRGVQGGFTLARPSKEISVREIFEALRKEKFTQTSFCSHFPGHMSECVHMEGCSVRPVYTLLFSYFDGLLGEISLFDLMQDENHVKKTLKTRWLETADKIGSEAKL